MIEPRIYRAAFLPTLLAVVVAMFSLEPRPAPAPQGLAADVLFEGRLANVTLERIVRNMRDRRPGTAGNLEAAELAVERFRRHGFEPVVRQRFRAEGEPLVNVVARRAGTSRDQVVVMAARDTADRAPDATGTAADTAALLELARVFEGRATRRTVVLASVDGSSLGDAGARHFLRTAEDRGRIKAIVVISNLAAGRSRGPLLVQWSNDASRGGIGLYRTAATSMREELGGLPGDEGALGQLARLAFPLAIGAQGSLIEEGADAVRISGSGELPPPERGLEEVDVERLGRLGRAALRTAGALDGRELVEHGPRSYLIVARNVLPGWAVAMLAAVLLIPPLVASIDAFARANRRRERVGRLAAWTLAGALPFAVGLGIAELLTVAGQAPDAPSAAFPPGRFEPGGGAIVALALVAVAVALAWALLRPWLARRAVEAVRERRALAPAPPSEPDRHGLASGGAAAVVSLAISLTALAVWFVNPFAALVLVPAVHLWILAMVADARRPATALLVLVGLVGPGGVALYYLARLSLDPLEGAWYLFLLVTGHHVGLATALLGCLVLGVAGSALAVMLARLRSLEPSPPAGPPLRGPSGYAGPGSLGGTESALRR